MGYEYKFMRMGEGWLQVRTEAKQGYRAVIEEHAAEGWRLVQIFAPGTGSYGAAKFFELIFERPVSATKSGTQPLAYPGDAFGQPVVAATGEPLVRGPDGRPMRACPFCAEMIHAAAQLCRYCNRDVEPVEVTIQDVEPVTGVNRDAAADADEPTVPCERCGQATPRSRAVRFLGKTLCPADYQAALRG